MNESECYYKPCTIDKEDNVFISRLFSIHNDFEVVSLRDSVIWRIENSDYSLGSINFDFVVDLYCCKHPIPSVTENDGTFLFETFSTSSDCYKDDIVRMCLLFHF